MVIGLYNGLYTRMKPVTGWAMIPGAACGALPFWIGWLAGGGGLVAVTPVYFFALYFVWQMPHFWMLAESNAEDYAAAGFPVPANAFSGFSRQVIPRLWALALALLGGMARSSALRPIRARPTPWPRPVRPMRSSRSSRGPGCCVMFPTASWPEWWR